MNVNQIQQADNHLRKQQLYQKLLKLKQDADRLWLRASNHKKGIANGDPAYEPPMSSS